MLVAQLLVATTVILVTGVSTGRRLGAATMAV